MTDSYLAHYGVLGMKWGVRKDRLSSPNSKSANLDKWGSDANHNILYVTGLSGSGKSTLAYSLRSKRTNVISLDLYFNYSKNARSDMDSEFTDFLKSKKKIDVTTMDESDIKNPNKKQEHFNKVDSIVDAYEEFGKKQFSKGKKVVVEGVQLADGFIEYSRFKDAPFVSMSTSLSKSLYRAAKRDALTIRDMDAVLARIKWGKVWKSNINNIDQYLDLQKTDEFLLPYLDKIVKGKQYD